MGRADEDSDMPLTSEFLHDTEFVDTLVQAMDISEFSKRHAQFRSRE